MSPFGAVTMALGPLRPVANSATENPSGAWGSAFAGRFLSEAMRVAEGVAKGGGRSDTVILRRTPGASLVQSPMPSLPVFSSAADAQENAATATGTGINRRRNFMSPAYRSKTFFTSPVFF